MPRSRDISLDGDRLRWRILWCDRTALFFFILGLLFNLWVVARWARQPLLDQHYFRQTQTAMTAWWLVQQPGLVHWFDYETPIFGSPWQIPLEFPLFQWGVALVGLVTGLPMDPLGRCLSALFFYAILGPLWMLCRDFGLNRRAFFLAAGLLLLSPVYLYWSRCFLIESTALFFSLLYLACLKRHLSGGSRWWLLLLPLAGAASVLTKVTTFAPFAPCACLMLVAQVWQQRLWRQPMRGMKVCLPPLASLLVCSLVIVLWLGHTEGLIQSSYFGYILTPGRLHSWTYGSLEQRASLQLWRDTIWQRAITDALGWRILLLLLLIPNLRAKPGLGTIKAVLVALFLLPFLCFTKLHIVHNYYQYANALFLVLAVALGVWQLGQFNSPLLLALVCALAAFAEAGGFCRGFFHSVRTHYSDDPLLRAAKALRERTPSDSVLLIVGGDWNPALAYYSARRSIYVPAWATRDQVERLLEAPDRLTGGKPIGAVIDYPGGYPPRGTELWTDFLDTLAPESTLLKEGPYELYFPRDIHAWKRNLASDQTPSQASQLNREGEWTRRLPTSWLAHERTDTAPGHLEKVELYGKTVARSDEPLLTEPGAQLRLEGWFQRGNASGHSSVVLLEICGKKSWFARFIPGPCSLRRDEQSPGDEVHESVGFDFDCHLPEHMPEDTYQLCVYQTNASALLRLNLPLQLIVDASCTETLPPEWPAIKSATAAMGNLERIELDGKVVRAAGVPLSVNRGSVLALLGWSADGTQAESPPERLLALRATGDTVVRYVPVGRWKRPDVAQALGNPKLQETGFKVNWTIGPYIPAGSYRLDIIQRGSGAVFKVPLSLEVLP